MLFRSTIKPKRPKMPLATFEGSIRVGQEKAVVAEEITLPYGYIEAVQPAAETANFGFRRVLIPQVPLSMV